MVAVHFLEFLGRLVETRIAAQVTAAIRADLLKNLSTTDLI
jgi:hypothetical protein